MAFLRPLWFSIHLIHQTKHILAIQTKAHHRAIPRTPTSHTNQKIKMRNRRRCSRRGIRPSLTCRSPIHHPSNINHCLRVPNTSNAIPSSTHSPFIFIFRQPFRNGGFDCYCLCASSSYRIHVAWRPLFVSFLDDGLPGDAGCYRSGWDIYSDCCGNGV